jgi:hypothetical protein
VCNVKSPESSLPYCVPTFLYIFRNSWITLILIPPHLHDCASWQILIIKPTRCTNFSNLLWNETLHVSDSSSAHYQKFFTVHTAMVYVILVCRQLSSSRIRIFPNKLEKISTSSWFYFKDYFNNIRWFHISDNIYFPCQYTFVYW